MGEERFQELYAVFLLLRIQRHSECRMGFLSRFDLRYISPRIHWFAEPGEVPGS